MRRSLVSWKFLRRRVFRSLGGLKIFGEKTLGKCAMYIGVAVMPRLCCPVFHFHQF